MKSADPLQEGQRCLFPPVRPPRVRALGIIPGTEMEEQAIPAQAQICFYSPLKPKGKHELIPQTKTDPTRYIQTPTKEVSFCPLLPLAQGRSLKKKKKTPRWEEGSDGLLFAGESSFSLGA